MKVIEKKRTKTISAKTPAEFDKLYNQTFEELGEYEPDVREFEMDGTMFARFNYTVTDKIAEDTGDIFMQHNVECTCSDCPFLEIGTDARRKWFPCKYASCGETRLDSRACEVFYKEAVRRMREEAGR